MPSALVILTVVSAILIALVIKDLLVGRAWTPAIKTRLIVVALFAVVMLWLQWHPLTAH